jgi:hypothetical protein
MVMVLCVKATVPLPLNWGWKTAVNHRNWPAATGFISVLLKH